MYCSNCGRELRDGEICSCTQNSTAVKNEVSKKIAEEKEEKNAGYDLNRLFLAFVSVFTLILELIKRPCSTVQDFMVRDNGKMGIKLMLVKAGILCLFVQTFDFYTGMTRAGMFIAVFMVSFALDFVYSFVIDLCARTIAKAELDTVRSMEISGLKAAGETAGIICAAVCSIFFETISFVFIFIGALFGMLLSYTAVLQLADIDKDKRVHIYIASAVVMGIITAVVLTIVSGGMLISTIKNWIY